MDHELLQQMGTDAQQWAQELKKVIAKTFSWSTEKTEGDPDFEMESLLTTWFANAIEVGRDAGHGSAESEGPSRPPENLAERAIRTLEECATALEALPLGMRTSAMGGIFGNLPLNRADQMRQEADDIRIRVSTAAAATQEV